MIIENTQDFEAFIERAQKSAVLAIDTEFLREKTYYAQLCLLQLATDDEVVIVDPFTVDLTPLKSLLENPAIVKLFHAARQDIEILYHELHTLPHPLFDTQIAASVLGYPLQVGLGALVHNRCGVELKKLDSFTDWSRRPLSDSQLAYAAEDVIYLPQIYHSMMEELERKGRLSWLEPEFAALQDEARYQEDPYTRFYHLKNVSKLNCQQLSAAREVAAWRELRAQKINIPRRRVLSDEIIIGACRREARTIDELFMVRGARGALDTAQARQVVSLIAKGLDAPADTWPHLDNARNSAEPSVDHMVDMMTTLVRFRAQENDIASAVLADNKDLVKLARGYGEETELLSGWRWELVGEELLALMEGRIALRLLDNEIEAISLP